MRIYQRNEDNEIERNPAEEQEVEKVEEKCISDAPAPDYFDGPHDMFILMTTTGREIEHLLQKALPLDGSESDDILSGKLNEGLFHKEGKAILMYIPAASWGDVKRFCAYVVRDGYTEAMKADELMGKAPKPLPLPEFMNSPSPGGTSADPAEFLAGLREAAGAG
ncbi:MAG: hypothetical protein U9P00_02405 [Pseudomonadota bacterium]|nr:hypothetical protein [Pseudomonadota bacterium]